MVNRQTNSDYLQNQAYDDAFDLNLRTQILKHHRIRAESWYGWLFEQMRLPQNGRILDLGCGPADLWGQNEKQLRDTWRICLADLSDGMVEAARKRVGDASPAFSFALLDSTALPFPENSFDVVLSFGLLDHLPDMPVALAEIRRVLRPGGFFYASAGGRSHLQELECLVRPFLPDVQYGGDAEKFGLDNGAGFLAPFFSEVEQRPYENTLAFRDPDPLAAYVLSEAAVRQRLSASQWNAFQSHLKQKLRAQQEIRVTIKKGLFIGKKQAPPERGAGE